MAGERVLVRGQRLRPSAVYHMQSLVRHGAFDFIRVLEQDNIKDFIKVPPVAGNVMYDYIVNTVKLSHSLGSQSFVTAVTLKLLEENKYYFCTSSAAVAMHHNLLGGLLYHTYRMVQAAECLSNVYTELDKELLVCGAALHDIGKIHEYETTKLGEASVTEVGALMGHLYIGAEMLHDTANRLKMEKDEKVMLLKHMILSHHGIQEWGAVMPPAIPEAFVLHYIDNIDAKIYTCFDVLQSVEEGCVTEKKPFGLDNRLYKRIEN